MSTIGLLLGKPPMRSPGIGTLLTRLREQGHLVRMHVPGPDGPAVPWLTDTDLVALRGLDRRALVGLRAAEARGVRFLDAPAAVLAVRDRRGVSERLRAAGLPTPASWSAPRWSDVHDLAGRHGGRLVVKHADGTVGRSARVWISSGGRLPELAPFPGPFHVERHVGTGRRELKLYRVGAHTAGFALQEGTATTIEVDDHLRRLVTRATDALGLSLAGLDILVDDAEVFVIDVNAFPSCRRLSDGPERIAAHLVERARPGGDLHDHPRADVPHVGVR